MLASSFGIGTPVTQPNLSFAPFGAQLYGQPLAFTSYGLQQPQTLQQIAQVLQIVPQQLQHLQQLQYLQQQQLQQVQQLLQVIPAQLAQIQQQIQFVPQQIQQGVQPFAQSFSQGPVGSGLGASSPWGLGSPFVSAQPGHLM